MNGNNDEMGQYLNKYPIEEDIKMMLRELLLHKKMGLEALLNNVETEISKSNERGIKQFNLFKDEFQKAFPDNSGLRGAAEGLVFTLFHNVFELFYIGNNSSLLVELQGLLERFAIDQLCNILAVNKEAKEILRDAFNKKTLNDVSKYYVDLQLWDEEDEKFAKKISIIRNGIAHKNASIVSKHLGNGKQNSISSIHSITQKTNVIPYIIQVIKMIIKLTEVLKPNILKNACFNARLEAYNLIFKGMMNFHCEMALENIPIEIKTVILNRLYSKAILLSSEQLADYLSEFKNKSLEFHQLVIEKKNVDDIYEALCALYELIVKEMKKHLNIDNNTGIFLDEKISIKTLEEVKQYIEKGKTQNF